MSDEAKNLIRKLLALYYVGKNNGSYEFYMNQSKAWDAIEATPEQIFTELEKEISE